MAVYAAGFGAYKADVKPADVFPGAEKFGPVEGAPPAAAAYRNGVVAGYVIETSDIGYSGKPIRILAGLDNNGTITGAKVIEHHEPILLVGISPDKLFGVVLHGCNRAIVRNNRIANRADLWPNDRGNGIHIWNNTGALVEGNTVTSGRDGLYIEISHDNVIRGNRFEGMRFAVHYMYANNNEVSGNISIRNHVGFALMYSKNLKVFWNISISDLQHGLMLHTTHKSEVRDNFIYGTGEKCLFVYTSANNDIHDNRFEQCGIGVHFTGGSENNKFHGNSFVANEMQVKYTGLKTYEWSDKSRGNYWSDNPAFDLDGDGVADAAYRPNTLVDWVLWKYPLAKMLIASPAVQTLRYIQEQLPTLYPGGAIDSFPMMEAAPPPVAIPAGTDLTPAPRDPAQAGSDQRPIM